MTYWEHAHRHQQETPLDNDGCYQSSTYLGAVSDVVRGAFSCFPALPPTLSISHKKLCHFLFTFKSIAIKATTSFSFPCRRDLRNTLIDWTYMDAMSETKKKTFAKTTFQYENRSQAILLFSLQIVIYNNTYNDGSCCIFQLLAVPQISVVLPLSYWSQRHISNFIRSSCCLVKFLMHVCPIQQWRLTSTVPITVWPNQFFLISSPF